MQKAKVILSTLLIPIVLWAGMGFSLNRHYCLGMLVDEAWYFVSNDCQPHDTEKKQSCKESISSTDSCCSDQWISIAGVSISSQTPQGTNEYLDLPNNTAIALKEPWILPNSYEAKIGKLNSSVGPPLRIQEIVIEYQRFLI